MNIVPGILTKDVEEFTEQVSIAHKHVEWVQIDIEDGKFVSETTIALSDIPDGALDGVSAEAHLMVTDPGAHIEECRRLGFRRIIFHYSAISEHRTLIDAIKAAGMQAALALSPEDTVDDAAQLFDQLDAVLVMTIHPGPQGQELIPDLLQKIQDIRVIEPDIIIGIDGGVKLDTMKLLQGYSLDYAVVGSGIWKSPDPAQAIAQYKQQVQ